MKRTFRGRTLVAAIVTLGCLIGVASLVVGRAFSQSGDEKLPQQASSKGRGAAANARGEVPGVSAEQIKNVLVEAATKLVDLKIVVVENGDFTVRTPERPVPVTFKEMWVHRNSAQLRVDFRANGNGEDWWTGFKTVEAPLTTDRLASTTGMTQCVDMSRFLVSANSQLIRPGPRGEPRTIHVVSKCPQFISPLFVPFVELNSPWLPENLRGGSPVINTITSFPESAWYRLIEDKLGDEEVIRAEIDQQEPLKVPLKEHPGELVLAQGYMVWFAKRYGLMPVRIESSMRYGYQGRTFYWEHGPDGHAMLEYEASDFQQFKDVWVPRTGRQSTYLPKEQSSAGFNADKLVERLLADGKVVSKELTLGYRKEWKILELQPIDPSLNLWFGPQDGPEVINRETQKRYVQGDAVASAKYAAREQAVEAPIGKPAPEFPAGATWLNAEPVTWKSLSGKVVILDFWTDTCAPCRNAMPRLNELHHDREKNGLVIIGVHLAGSEPANVKKAVDELHLDYPICIDKLDSRKPEANAAELFPGEFSSQFGIDAIPHFVVVDRRGIVAASSVNQFEEILIIAEKLANELE